MLTESEELLLQVEHSLRECEGPDMPTITLHGAIRMWEGVEQRIDYRCWALTPDRFGITRLRGKPSDDSPDYVLHVAEFSSERELVCEIVRLLGVIIVTDPVHSALVDTYRDNPEAFVANLPPSFYVLGLHTDPYVTKHGTGLRLYLRRYENIQSLLKDTEASTWQAMWRLTNILARLIAS